MKKETTYKDPNGIDETTLQDPTQAARLLLKESGIDDDELRSLAPRPWKPMRKQIMFVKAYIISAQTKSKRALAMELGIPIDTMYAWFKGRSFRDWISIAKIQFAGKLGVPLTWEKIATDAVAGNDKAQHKLLMRFDPIYRDAYNKVQSKPRDPVDPRLVADDAAATLALQAASPSRRTLQHKPTRIIDIDED